MLPMTSPLDWKMSWTKNTIGENLTIDMMFKNYCMACGDEPHCATACAEEECDCDYCACDDCSG